MQHLSYFEAYKCWLSAIIDVDSDVYVKVGWSRSSSILSKKLGIPQVNERVSIYYVTLIYGRFFHQCK